MPTNADHCHDEATAIEPPANNTVPRALYVKLQQRDRIVHRVASMADPHQVTGVSSHQLEVMSLQLERHYDTFQRLQDNIEMEDEEAFEHSHRDDFENTYCEVKALIAQQLDTVRVSPPQPHNSTVISSSSRRVNLPKLQLPKFGGHPKEWLDFHNMFQVLVHENWELSDIEKFQYLRSCLTDKAAKLIQALEVTAANYAKAVELLTMRYNNKRYIFTAHLQEIFDIKKIQNPTVPALREYIDVVNANLRALQSLATSQQITDGILLQLVTAKLDSDTQSKWEEEVSKIMEAQSHNNSIRLPTWADLSLFMERRCQTLNLIESGRTNKATRTAPSTPSTPRQTKVALVSSTSSKCVLCNETPHHNPFKCQRFMALDTVARYQQAKRGNLCLNCLTPGHVSNKCPSTKRCQTCGVSHHTLLHRHQETNSQSRVDAALTVEAAPSPTTLQVSLNQSQVILGTALIQISTSRGNVMQARALLDSASQLNFITEHVAQQLRVKRLPTHLEIAGIAQKSTAVRQTASVTISSLADGYTASINAVILSTITSNQPHRFIDTSNWSIPPNIRLADTEFHIPGPIDVLIGATLFFNLMLVGQIKVREVVFQKTHLGWIASGECQQSPPPNSSMPYKSFITTSEERTVDYALERFWTMEDTPAHSSPPFTQEESRCEQFFEETVRRCPTTGKFIVRLPFKENPSALGQSVDAANKRLSSLQARLRRNPNLHQQYVAFLNEYTELRHMEVCSAEYILTHTINYIPHHCVVKEDSSTTKLRVVFDASCHTSSGKSLNDVLMVGPTVQDDLITILLRFRRHAYVIMADIAKMYRQVWVNEQDTAFQCILWNDNPKENPSTYQLKTITYGTSCAPYLAIKCLRTLAEQHVVDLPVGATATLQDFYVDNLMSGGSTITEVIDLRNQVTTLLNHGGFPLRKFASNHTAILEDINPDDQEEIVQLDGVDYVKALGLKWAPREDCFIFHYSPQVAPKHTSKRSILSHIATFFDPLGLLNPVIVTCKILMQELWKLKLQWDESVPQHISTEWETIKSEMDHLARLRIPSFLPITTLTQLHIFADASTKAYGACVYAVTTNHQGTTSSLLCAKSRVAPTKEVSVPRLELCAALIASELAAALAAIYNVLANNIYCWSDSQITLAWIKGEPSRWNVFVANRVTKIQQHTAPSSWHHVPSAHNPADLVSRGSTASNLINSTLWFQGPEFITGGYDHGPPQQPIGDDEVPEQRNQRTTLATTVKTDIIGHHKYVNNFEKLCRIFAYVQRFVQHSRTRNLPYTTHKIEAPEANNALITICKIIQQIYYSTDISNISSGIPLSQRSPLISLTPFVHEGILRVGGRLTNSSLPFSSKHPILLPASHPFIDTLISHFHRKHLHAGAQTLHNVLRSNFWIINARSTIKKVIRQCVICVRCRPILAQQLLGNLPTPRLEVSQPFETCGVDYCGPLVYTQRIRHRPPIKVYLAIFICFSTKAVHMELVPDLTTAAFIAALRRFIARRGKCRTIFSDNATNFVGANRELRELLNSFTTHQHIDEVNSACTAEGIEWKFIPPRSPHFGGLWESAVKQAKHFLRRTIGNHILTWDELHTLVCQIEALINSRPLTQLSGDPNDMQPLTPAHFLIGRNLTSIPEPSLPPQDSLRRYQLVQGLQQQFWRRWHVEYLHELQQRQKWKSPTPNLQPGDVVIIKDDNTPPSKWPLGRIQKTISGTDGHTRVVVIKTAHGTCERAVARVCKLPTNDTTSVSSEDPNQSSQVSQGIPHSS